MKSPTTNFLRVSIIILFLIGVFTYFISVYIEKKIQSRLKTSGVEIESIDFSLFRRTLILKNTTWSQLDSLGFPMHKMEARNVVVSGISLTPLLFHKALEVENFLIENGNIQYAKNQKFSTREDSSSKSKIESIIISDVTFRNISCQVIQDTVTIFSAMVGMNLKEIRWEKSSVTNEEPFQVESIEITGEDLSFHKLQGEYKIEADRIHFFSQERSLEIDSLKFIPLEGKYEFARKAKKQETRVTLLTSEINIVGIDFNLLKDSILAVSKIEINNPNLWLFRDKRLPFKNPYIPLPMQLLKKAPIGLKIDSIKIHNGKIRHEELSESGKEPGHLDFTNLEASISNFNNRLYQDRPSFAFIQASSKMMKSGFIQASFRLPVEDGKRYSTQGKITHLNLPELNTMTEPVAFLRLESGMLNRLSFNFEYDDRKSQGQVEMNYENLKITGLTKGDVKKTVNPFKTLLINTFVKNDKNAKTPKEDRTGTINIERDRRKFVANLWAKSIFSGIESVLLPGAIQTKKPKR